MRYNEIIAALAEGKKTDPTFNVDEAFDNPYKGKWEKSEYSDSVDMLVKLPDGTNLSIMFNMEYDDEGNEVVLVEFHRNNSQDVTGEGDAQRIFATVLDAIQKYIKKYKPQKLSFSASKSVDMDADDVEQFNPESRAKLYTRLVQRYAGAWGYQSQHSDEGDVVIYQLTRAQGLAEAKTVEYNGLTLRIKKPTSYELRVEALDDWGNKVLGYVEFDIGDGKELDPQDLRVDDKYQGQGIAKTMYDYVKQLGYTIVRSWDQTDAGAGFWDKHRGEDVRVWENNTAAGINKMFNNLGDPVFANLQRVALLAMQGRQSEAAGRLQTVIKDADPAVQKKIIDAVNNIKPVTINGRVADSSTLDKSKQHNDWIIRTFVPWVQSLLGQTVSENFHDGKNPQDKGDSKRHGVPTKASISTLRKVAKQGGRKGQLAHWMANMKSGRAKAKK
jgi:ribosomal protein S18 acetylase RimI-like enzyme